MATETEELRLHAHRLHARTKASGEQKKSHERAKKMKRLLLAAAFACIASAAHAQGWGNPWEEADGRDRIYIPLTSVACGLGKDVQRFMIWLPYDTAANKSLDFYRLTPQLPAMPLKGKITIKEGDKFPEIFLDGKKCERWPGGEQ
jgi:hypothetical protein